MSFIVFQFHNLSNHATFAKQQISDATILPLGTSLGISEGIELGWSEGTSIEMR